MARTQVPRNLPPLEELFQDFTGFTGNGSKQLALAEILKKSFKQLRKKESRPFYSMREVAEYFHLPLRTVALVYRALEREGLLSCFRGSQTMLVGKTLAPRTRVKAVVGIPLWFHALIVSPYSRALNMEFEERLRENGFVADIIFYRGDASIEPEFAQRLLDHNLDQVIWHSPHPLSQNVLLTLKDHGVKQIVVQHTETQTSLDFPSYLLEWRPAYKMLASTWYKAGIRSVIVPDPIYLPSKKAVRGFFSILTQQGLKVELVENKANLIREKVLASQKTSCALAFIDQQGADAICNEEPVIIEELLQAARVAFCRGPIRLPYFAHRPGKVDLVRFSPMEVADRVVDDMVKGVIPAQGLIHTFEAGYEAQVDLNQQAELL